jgi:hypothetical protein
MNGPAFFGQHWIPPKYYLKLLKPQTHTWNQNCLNLRSEANNNIDEKNARLSPHSLIYINNQ